MWDRLQDYDPRPSRAGSLALLGGSPCLDFANTASGRGTDVAMEHIRSYDDLLTWAVHAQVIGQDARGRLGDLAEQEPEGADFMFHKAITLREALHAVGVAIASAAEPDPKATEVFRNAFSGCMRHADFGRGDDAYGWWWPEDVDDLELPLWPVAYSAGMLFPEADPKRIKQCPAEDCGWLFLDRSKNASRRWCDMRTCGNRAKARRHYARVSGSVTPDISE